MGRDGKRAMGRREMSENRGWEALVCESKQLSERGRTEGVLGEVATEDDRGWQGLLSSEIDSVAVTVREKDGFVAAQDEELHLKVYVEEWVNVSQDAALGGHSVIDEDGPEVCGAEQAEEEHGDSLTGMYAPGTSSLEQSRIRGRGRDPLGQTGNVRMIEDTTTELLFRQDRG
jgi:hypothetical protein